MNPKIPEAAAKAVIVAITTALAFIGKNVFNNNKTKNTGG